MTIRQMQNIFLEEISLTDILLSLLTENAEYADCIQEIVNNPLEIGDVTNECYV